MWAFGSQELRGAGAGKEREDGRSSSRKAGQVPPRTDQGPVLPPEADGSRKPLKLGYNHRAEIRVKQMRHSPQM